MSKCDIRQLSLIRKIRNRFPFGLWINSDNEGIHNLYNRQINDEIIKKKTIIYLKNHLNCFVEFSFKWISVNKLWLLLNFYCINGFFWVELFEEELALMTILIAWNKLLGLML